MRVHGIRQVKVGYSRQSLVNSYRSRSILDRPSHLDVAPFGEAGVWRECYCSISVDLHLARYSLTLTRISAYDADLFYSVSWPVLLRQVDYGVIRSRRPALVRDAAYSPTPQATPIGV